MAVRYSGRVRVNILWDDRLDAYRATVLVPGFGSHHMTIGAPKHLTRAVDSPAAYDQAAGAAISFADDFRELAEVNRTGTGWHITRSPSRAKANPSRIDFGRPYGEEPMVNNRGRQIFMHRRGQKVRFYDRNGRQVGPEHRNVAPAMAWAHASGYYSPSLAAAIGLPPRR